MKGALGLTIAAGLGIVGAICNWLYLQQLAATQETVSLIGVKRGVQLNIGDPFEESDLEPVPIPRDRSGNLIERAPLWSARSAVVGYGANRVFHGGEILLNADTEAPAVRNLAETLGDDEVARWVPIDTRAVVTEQINPGDMVSFDVGSAGPTPAGGASTIPRTGTADHRPLPGSRARRPPRAGKHRTVCPSTRRHGHEYHCHHRQNGQRRVRTARRRTVRRPPHRRHTGSRRPTPLLTD
jgi:hypothetical protein